MRQRAGTPRNVSSRRYFYHDRLSNVQPPLDEHVTSSSFSEYQLRLVQPSLCDPSVKQYSGYLDISDGKHLFFWCVSPSSLL